MTNEESASLFDLTSLQTTTTRVAPRAYWGVGRVQQEFGRLGSTVGLLASAVHRDVVDGDPLGDLLT